MTKFKGSFDPTLQITGTLRPREVFVATLPDRIVPLLPMIDGQVLLDAVSALLGSASRIFQDAVEWSAFTATTALPSLLVAGAITVSSAGTLASDANTILGATWQAQAQSTTSAFGNTLVVGASSLQGQSSVLADGDVIGVLVPVFGEASLAAQSAIDVSANTILGATWQSDAQSTQSGDATVRLIGQTQSDANGAIVASINLQLNSASDAAAQSALSAVGINLIGAAIQAEATSTLSSQATLLVGVASNLEATSTLTSEATLLVGIESTAEANSSLSSQATLLVGIESTAEATSTLTSEATLLVGIESTAEATSTLTSEATLLVGVASNLEAVSSLSADGDVEVSSIVPFEAEAFSFLDAFKLLDEGYVTNDPIEVWPNALPVANGDAYQLTVASQPKFIEDANSTGIPGLLFDGLTTVHMELGDAWRLPENGPWTMYYALRRNSTLTRIISFWSNQAGSNIAYALSHVSSARFNFTANGVFSGNQLTNTNIDNFYSFLNNQRRLLSITKREDNGYTICIDNILIYQTDADGTITTPTVQPLLGTRWNSAGTAKEFFLHSTMLGVLGYNTAHDAAKREQVSQFIFDRYAITPPHVEDRDTSIAAVLDLDQRGNWINADTGTTATDLSTYSKNGTYQNGVTLEQPPLAKSGESALFTAASSQYVSDIGSVGDYNFMRATNVWTFGAWIRPVSGLTNYQLLLSTTTSTDDVGVWIGIDKAGSNRQMRIDVCGPTGQQLNIRSLNTIWTNNLTAFVTVVSDGSFVRFYQNGQLWGQTAITATTTTDDHSFPLALAGPQEGYFNGSMQLAFVSNRALTQPEIIDIYASTRLELGE